MSETPPQQSVVSSPAPEACASLDDVRAGVDAVDRALVVLMARRQAYVDAAARFKAGRDSVRDDERMTQILEKVQAEAWENGLAWTIAEPVWRAMLEACARHALLIFDETERGSGGDGIVSE